MASIKRATEVGLPFINESAAVVSQLLAVIDDRILDKSIKVDDLTDHEQKLLERGHRFINYADSIIDQR